MSEWEKARAWGIKDIYAGKVNGYSPDTIFDDLVNTLEAHGFVLVPKHATYPMMRAAAAEDWPRPDIYGDFDPLRQERESEHIYHAMVLAALKDRT